MEQQGGVGYERTTIVYIGETSMSGPERSETLKLPHQTTTESDRTDSVVQKFQMKTEAGRFDRHVINENGKAVCILKVCASSASRLCPISSRYTT